MVAGLLVEQTISTGEIFGPDYQEKSHCQVVWVSSNSSFKIRRGRRLQRADISGHIAYDDAPLDDCHYPSRILDVARGCYCQV